MAAMGAKNCVVTGGAGFIGSHLTERLLADGHRVHVIDNHVTGRPQNLAHLRPSPRLSETTMDVAACHPDGPFDGAEWVFHVAALADVVPSIEQPEHYYRANVEGTFQVLEAARAVGAERFVYTASSTCYGISNLYPTPETAEIRSQFPYALTKHLGECLALHWAQVYRLPAVSLRLFNVFGPRARTSGTYGAVFGVFLRQKLAGHPFTVVGDGTQTRDFTYVTDVVEAIVAAAASDVVGEAMNVGSGQTYSVNRLVELLGGDVIHLPKRPGEPDCTFADISKIKRLLGWRPKVSFEEGVEKVLTEIEYWRDAPLWTPESIAKATKDWFAYLG